MSKEITSTTVDLPTDVYRRLKQQAQDQNRSVRELILLGIERVLHHTERPATERLELPLLRSKRLDAKVELTNEEIYGGIEFP